MADQWWPATAPLPKRGALCRRAGPGRYLPARAAGEAGRLPRRASRSRAGQHGGELPDRRQASCPATGPRPMTPGLIDWLILVRNPFVWSSVMFRADAARRLDPLERPELRYVEDFDLYHRLRKFGQLAQIDEELLLYRCHDARRVATSITATMPRMPRHCSPSATPRGWARADPGIAPLVVRYCMAREPIPDGARSNGSSPASLRCAPISPRAGTIRRHELALVDREISPAVVAPVPRRRPLRHAPAQSCARRPAGGRGAGRGAGDGPCAEPDDRRRSRAAAKRRRKGFRLTQPRFVPSADLRERPAPCGALPTET
jgi:hypothetical protein